MSVERAIEDQSQARLMLLQCALYARERDSIIRRSRELGLSITEIARILGMNRGHISDIANTTPGEPPNASQGERPAQHPKDDTHGTS